MRISASLEGCLTKPYSREFGLLQKNVLNTQGRATREELRLAIGTWTRPGTTARRWRQRGLGKLTPIEFEMIYAAADTS